MEPMSAIFSAGVSRALVLRAVACMEASLDPVLRCSARNCFSSGRNSPIFSKYSSLSTSFRSRGFLKESMFSLSFLPTFLLCLMASSYASCFFSTFPSRMQELAILEMSSSTTLGLLFLFGCTSSTFVTFFTSILMSRWLERSLGFWFSLCFLFPTSELFFRWCRISTGILAFEQSDYDVGYFLTSMQWSRRTFQL